MVDNCTVRRHECLRHSYIYIKSLKLAVSEAQFRIDQLRREWCCYGPDKARFWGMVLTTRVRDVLTEVLQWAETKHAEAIQNWWTIENAWRTQIGYEVYQ